VLICNGWLACYGTLQLVAAAAGGARRPTCGATHPAPHSHPAPRPKQSRCGQGSRRVKLGLRDFVSLGDFVQRICDERRVAVGAHACTSSQRLGAPMPDLQRWDPSRGPSRPDAGTATFSAAAKHAYAVDYKSAMEYRFTEHARQGTPHPCPLNSLGARAAG